MHVTRRGGREERWMKVGEWEGLIRDRAKGTASILTIDLDANKPSKRRNQLRLFDRFRLVWKVRRSSQQVPLSEARRRLNPANSLTRSPGT